MEEKSNLKGLKKLRIYQYLKSQINQKWLLPKQSLSYEVYFDDPYCA